jgi:large subunit ribosomal protein L9
MANKQIILTENVPNLGAEADVVKVRAGYARNYLIPRGMAYEVTPSTLRQIDRLKAKRAERESRELQDAETLARKISKLRLTMTLATGETGKAFGAITAHDIVERLKSELAGTLLDRHKVELERPIKDTGEHEIPIRLHPDVIPVLRLEVQAAGAADKEKEKERVTREGAEPKEEKKGRERPRR